MNGVNLIPMQRREARARKSHGLKVAVMLGLYGGAVLTACLLMWHYGPSDSRELRTENGRLTRQLSVSNRLVVAVGADLGIARKKLQTAQSISQQPDWGAMLALLANKIGGDVVLNDCRMERLEAQAPRPSGADETPSPDKASLVLELGGFAKAQADVSDYVLRLENLGLFQKVRLVKTSRERYLNQEAVLFRLECLLGGSGGTKS